MHNCVRELMGTEKNKRHKDWEKNQVPLISFPSLSFWEVHKCLIYAIKHIIKKNPEKPKCILICVTYHLHLSKHQYMLIDNRVSPNV